MGRNESFDYDAYRDADLDSEAEDDDSRQQATQHNAELARERRLQAAAAVGRRPADNAIIERIDCTNFMCHARLELKFGPHINFILGHNGSGKSAALTALQLCLGGKTTSTNRGGKLSDFIQHGKDFAVLSVRIKNQGTGAYMPELYGPSIVVERSFTRTGQSGFKLKNSQGKIISQKKSDLEAITDAFALQLDNPMMCLTQDQARQFINDSGPREKYKFFFKGTQLEALDRDYRIMSEGLDKLGDILENLEEDQSLAARAWKAAQEKARESETLEKLTDLRRTRTRQYAWVQVREQEDNLEKHVQHVQTFVGKIQRLQDKAQAISTTYEQADAACSEAVQALDDLERSKVPHDEEKAPLKDEFKTNAADLAAVQTTERHIKQKISNAKKMKQNLEKDIEEEQQRIADAQDGQHAEILENLQNARMEVEEREREHQEHSRGIAEQEKARDDAEKRVAPAKQNISRVRGEIDKCRDTISAFERSKGQWMNAYLGIDPNKLRNLLNAIDKETKFKDKPVGPMGQYIRLLKPEWGSILERSFGGALSCFVCTSKADQSLLNEIMRRVGW